MLKEENYLNKLKIQNQRPVIIAGGCSAESEEQVRQVSLHLDKLPVDIIRFGVWKPRTFPGSFEGVGEKGFAWLSTVKKEISKPFTIEVATAKHVELALKNDIKILWIGARTTVNPFLVQDIADAINGVEGLTLMVKNPVNPDLKLWIGGLQRITKSGNHSLAAIHRGFSSFEHKKYRNEPLWQIPIALKQEMPEIPLIGDPSHIAGRADLVPEVAQKILDINYDGLMIETHPTPKNALSDAEQQISLNALEDLLKNLKFRQVHFSDAELIDRLQFLRDKIDDLDKFIIQQLAERMAIIEEIGQYKKDNNVAVFQSKRWKQILETRKKWAVQSDVSDDFIEKIYSLIHDESLRIQTEINLQNDHKR